jgi:hypothetical protein
MFSLTDDAAAYIKEKGGHVFISMIFEPSLGGCCKGDRIWGCYIPEITIGKPVQDSCFRQEIQKEITIWYPSRLIVKQGYESIRISVKSFIISKWLEIEGAQGISVTPKSGFQPE